MNKKGLSIAIILVVISIIGSIALFVGYKIHVNNKITQSIQELAKISINDLKEKHPKGEFPEEMKDFLSISKENLSDYCISHPSDFRDKGKMNHHYEGVLLYKKTDLYKYKKELLPKIKKMVGKYTKPDCFENNATPTQKNTLSYSPDLKQFQNTLIEWCLIANCFEEKDDGNSAFLLSYAAARLSIRLLTDYADGASEENLKTVNNILRCASCQLIYIANSGLKHNRNMVRAMAKDLYAISENFAPFSRTINYDLDLFDTIIKKLSTQGNYAISSTINSPSGEKQLLKQLRNFFRPLYEICDLSYSECGSKIVSWDKDLREKAQKAVNDLNKGNMAKLISYAFINSFLPNYNELKLFSDETRSIIDGTATVLATYEYIDNQTGSFRYSPSLIAKYVGSSPPYSRLSGLPIEILLPGSNIMSSQDNDVISYKNSETRIKMTKYNGIRSETIKNNFGMTFLTKNEYILKNLRQEYKSEYFDVDEALSKMTPEQRANYEKNLKEQEKIKQEAEKKIKETLKKNRNERVKVDSIENFLCGFKFGEKAKNVKESNYIDLGEFGITFCVESQKPFLGIFNLAEVFVDNDKRIETIDYNKSFDTTSQRETAFYRVQTAIEAMEGIKEVKHENNYEKEKIEYISEKDNCKIMLSILKGLDGGGTVSLSASSVNALLNSIKRE